MTTKTDRRAPGASTGQPTERAEVIPLHGGGRLVAPWKPGQSGNPNGVISVGAYHEARRICAEASPKAASIQVELMSSADQRIQILATEAVLNRGVGKPKDHGDDAAGQHINLSGLSSEELKSLGELLKKVLGL